MRAPHASDYGRVRFVNGGKCMRSTMTPSRTTLQGRLTQPERRARTRAALLEAAALGISRYGYANLVLERVAKDAGYTRGALYHQFANKEELALAVVGWVKQSWHEELRHLFTDDTDPVATLVEIARGYAIYCRHEISRVMMTLRAEFDGQDHPVGRAVQDALDRVVDNNARLIVAGRKSGAIPPGPPPRELALAFVGGIEGLVIHLAGQEPFDVQLAERAALGLLGLVPRRPRR
jgi:AcrR family transcriptional regulator